MRENSERKVGTNWWKLGFPAIVLGFLLLRLPTIYLQPGGEDEDCYAVAGLTILKTGLPQLPHVPSRDMHSVYYRADQVLYAEPPLSFYLQAGLYSFLPDVYGTARLASAIAGIILLWGVWKLTLEVTASHVAAFWGTALLSLSRWFYFPATRARPDIFCAMFGVIAIWLMFRWFRTRSRWDLVGLGIALGCGGLCHPFAILYAVQVAVCLSLFERGWKRLTVPAAVASLAIAVFAIWTPIIMIAPEAFKVQVQNQFFSDVNSLAKHLPDTPLQSLIYHGTYLWEHIGAWQCLLVIGPVLVATIFALKRQNRPLLTICLLVISSHLGLSLLIGTHHYSHGYWSYVASLGFLTTGWLIAVVIEWVTTSLKQKRSIQLTASVAAGVVLLLTLIPGSGIQATLVYLRNWDNPDYNAPMFAQELLKEVPEDATVIVDSQFTLDFIAAGRTTLFATKLPFYHNAATYDYSYVVASRYLIAQRETFDTELVSTAGKADDPFACYAEIRKRRSKETRDE